jgi:Tfp pilus assembly protein PilO
MDAILEKTEPRMLAIGLVMIVLLASMVQVTYLLWPEVKRYQALVASQELLSGAVNDDEGVLQALERARGEVKSLEHALHGDMAGLPAQQMESYIIGRLQKVSWQTNVDLISVKPGRGEQVQNFQESLFDIQIHARYRDFHHWLQMIGRELGFIVVKKFRIHPREQDAKDPMLDINLTMVSYRLVKP